MIGVDHALSFYLLVAASDPCVLLPPQPAVHAELEHSNIGSFFAIVKSARLAGYRHVALFHRVGAYSLFGWNRGLLLKNFFANVRFR